MMDEKEKEQIQAVFIRWERNILQFVGGHYSDQQWGCSKAVSIGFVLIVGNGY